MDDRFVYHGRRGGPASGGPVRHEGVIVAKPNYQYEKRARELAKKKKKEEKLKAKRERALSPEGTEAAEGAEGDTAEGGEDGEGSTETDGATEN